ncbi:MAG TPA: xanthine dehydrogenase family protein subunit M [Gaiellaceae bacterium]
MYPASFEYFAPRTLEEALQTLDRFGEEGKVIAGGQSLIPLMKLRFAAPRALIDINRIDGLDELGERDGQLRFGALVRHKTCERSELLRGRYGVFGEAARQIADPIVRNLGTVAGSLAHADPQGDWPSVMLAARGEIVARSSDGERTIAIDEFLQGPFTTALEPNEIVTEIRVPAPTGRAGGAYEKLERKIGDFATAGVAVHLTFANGSVEAAGIALTAVGPTNLRASAAEQALAGRVLDDAAIDEASRLAGEAAQPHDDTRGSAEYKRNVIRVLTARALRRAAADGQEEEFAGHETIEGVMEEISEKEDA